MPLAAGAFMTGMALALIPPKDQTTLQRWAFARRLCEVMDVAEAYRDTYEPWEEILPKHYQAGNGLLKREDVQEIVRTLVQPVLVELGVDKQYVLKKLLTTLEGDLTEYATIVVDSEGKEHSRFMSLHELQKLPPDKRKLIKKFEEKNTQFGLQRKIELRDPEAAMLLLARIQNMISDSNTTTVINNETIVMHMTLAAKGVDKRRADMVEKAQASNTAKQMDRPAVVTQKIEGQK